MNKIICDVCGTDYPETAAQCPICGCASAGAQTAAGNEAADADEKSAYAPVKGGRYSKANVRKRLKENQIPYDPIPEPDPEPEYEDDETLEEAEEEVEEPVSNRGLIILIGVLLLAIVAVASYIAISMFGIEIGELPFFNKQPTAVQTTPTTEPVIDPTTGSDPVSTDVPCNGLTLSDVDIFLSSVGSTWQLTATARPADTTDQIIFTSSDETVVTVDASGLVTAVGTGKASVTVTCGAMVVECPVACGEDATQDTQPTQTPDGFVLKLLSKDFTLKQVGATFDLYDGAVDPADITWTTDNAQIVTVDKGIVTAVGNGRTRVHAEYGDQKVSCWVSCKLPAEQNTDVEGSYALRINGNKPNYGTEQAAEVTLTLDEEITVKVVDQNGKRVDVEWRVSKKNVVTVEGTSVIGEQAGNTILSTEIDGQKLTINVVVRQ